MKRLFWKNFFALLLVFVAIAEWVCATWLLTSLAGARFPVVAHILGPAILYAINRAVVSRPLPPAGAARTLRRAYTGVAFTSIFGLLFLLIVATIWGAATAGLTGLYHVGIAESLLPVSALSDTARALATGGLLAVGGAMAYGYGIGQRRLWINRLDIPVPKLDKSLDGLRLAQISDVHLGGYTPIEAIARYVEQVNDLAPDLIVITGDITDGLEHAPTTFPVLAGLRAPLGVIAILGNHDVYAGADEVTELLRRHTDFTVLCDETLIVAKDDGRLSVVGLMDRGLDWARGLRECSILERLYRQLPAGSPTLVLSHRPDLFEHAASLGAALMLAGHTHGGQLAIPLRRGRTASLAHFMTRYPRGTFRLGDSWLHVNLGLGVTAQPVRIATPREITLIRLTAA